MRKCEWDWNQLYFYWATGCGRRWNLDDQGGAKKFVYCPFCGKKIKEKITRVRGVAI